MDHETLKTIEYVLLALAIWISAVGVVSAYIYGELEKTNIDVMAITTQYDGKHLTFQISVFFANKGDIDCIVRNSTIQFTYSEDNETFYGLGTVFINDTYLEPSDTLTIKPHIKLPLLVGSKGELLLESLFAGRHITLFFSGVFACTFGDFLGTPVFKTTYFLQGQVTITLHGSSIIVAWSPLKGGDEV